MARRKGLPSNKLVTWSLAATGIVILVSRAQRGEWPDPRTFIALAVVYVILGFAAEVAPQLAGPMAVLVFVAVLLTQGSAAFDGISAVVGAGPTRKKVTKVSPKKRKRLAADPNGPQNPGR
jgi:hypothetical protein